MNKLVERFGSAGLQVFGVPCNQFGHQENGKGQEILDSLMYVRPGKGFKPAFPLLEPCKVNGDKASELFKWLRISQPYCHDRTPELDMNEPYGYMSGTGLPDWSPRTPSDIMWNFEKFLVDKQGKPRYRFSPRFETKNLEPYIEALLKE